MGGRATIEGDILGPRGDLLHLRGRSESLALYYEVGNVNMDGVELGYRGGQKLRMVEFQTGFAFVSVSAESGEEAES